MSRKDKIISLALAASHSPPAAVQKQKKTTYSDITMSRKDKTISMALAASHSSPAAVQKQQISTDLNDLWSHPLDYNDFKIVFDFRNEYSNSFDVVQDIDLNIFIPITEQLERPVSRHSLKCHEIFQFSDEDDCNKNNVNIFEDSDDSVKDKDYIPDFSMDSDSDLSICNDISTINITLNAEVYNYHEKSSKDNNKVQKKRSNVLSDFRKRDNQIFDDITEYILPETSTGDLRDESLLTAPVTEENTKIFVSDRPEKEIETGSKERDCANDSPENERKDSEAERNKGEVESPSLLPANQKGFTKSGLPRKRRAYDIPLKERNKQKKESADAKLALKPPCNDKCRKKCMTKFTEEIRKDIHDRYVNLSWETRGLFIKGMVEPYTVKTRTNADSNNNTTKKRNVSYRYHFCVNNEKIEVCQVFFLTTLGYKPTNNRHIHLALSKEVDDQRDKRGSYERKNTLDKDLIKEHIQSFNPTISHYRREHAPNKFYLPSDLNITMMHQYFIEKYTNMQVSLETYRKVVKEMNISFAHLGHEECELCALYKSHNECSQESCELCIQYEKHKLYYTQTRQEYQNDKEQFCTDEDTIYFSVDLQKVIMLPRMDQFKTAIFCPRIIAFNESFVPLGSSSGTNVPFAVLWNETVSGRNQEDIISAFRSFLMYKRDVKHVVFWVDNCSAQNKNWAFMCFLINIVNSQLIAAESITVKYFEPGHTFMSADHFHHQVEMSLKKKQKVYDFDDFVDAVKLSNSKKNTVKVMTVSDFYLYQDLSSQHKIRNTEPRIYLKNIMAVKAERGQFSLKYKENHPADWKEFDFLQVKIIKNKSFPNVNSKVAFRGVTKERKERIITELLPLMPETRRDFWLNLPESSRVSNID